MSEAPNPKRTTCSMCGHRRLRRPVPGKPGWIVFICIKCDGADK